MRLFPLFIKGDVIIMLMVGIGIFITAAIMMLWEIAGAVLGVLSIVFLLFLAFVSVRH